MRLIPHRLRAPAVALCFGLILPATVMPITLSPAAEAAETSVIAPNLSHFTLKNGLEVVVIPDHRAPVVTHMIWYKVGAADEPEGQSGVAHFLEHLMFKGTKNHPNGEFSAMVAEHGGQENAFTSNDYTAYFQRVAKEDLPLMMQWEADRMENLVLNDDIIAPEKQVVLEERRMRVDSDPASRLRETMNAITYVNHPYGSPVIGWESEIKALNTKAVISFYDRFYTPNNAILVVAGDVTPDEVHKLAQETYGKVAQRANPGERVRPAEPKLSGARSVVLKDERVRQPSVMKSWVVPSEHTGKGADPQALDLLSQILGGGTTSRLYKSAVVEKKIAVDAGSYYVSTSYDDTQFGIYASPADGHTLADMDKMIADQLADIIKNGVTDKELARAKHSLVASAIYAQDSQQTMARIFGSALASGQTIDDVQNWPAHVEAVTKEDVQRVAKEYLSQDPVSGYLEPKMEDVSSAPADKATPADDGQKS